MRSWYNPLNGLYFLTSIKAARGLTVYVSIEDNLKNSIKDYLIHVVPHNANVLPTNQAHMCSNNTTSYTAIEFYGISNAVIA